MEHLGLSGIFGGWQVPSFSVLEYRSHRSQPYFGQRLHGMVTSDFYIKIFPAIFWGFTWIGQQAFVTPGRIDKDRFGWKKHGTRRAWSFEKPHNDQHAHVQRRKWARKTRLCTWMIIHQTRGETLTCGQKKKKMQMPLAQQTFSRHFHVKMRPPWDDPEFLTWSNSPRSPIKIPLAEEAERWTKKRNRRRRREKTNKPTVVLGIAWVHPGAIQKTCDPRWSQVFRGDLLRILRILEIGM